MLFTKRTKFQAYSKKIKIIKYFSLVHVHQMNLPCHLHRGRLFGDYRSFQQRKISGIVYYIAQSLANNAFMSSFHINTLPYCVHSVVPLTKLYPIFSSVVLIKLRYEQWLSISSFLDSHARFLKLNSQC